LCISDLEELTNGQFHRVIDDENVIVNKTHRVVFCSGKIYYDLLQRKLELEAKDVALIRIEELHPFPYDEVNEIINKYKNTLIHLWYRKNLKIWARGGIFKIL